MWQEKRYGVASPRPWHRQNGDFGANLADIFADRRHAAVVLTGLLGFWCLWGIRRTGVSLERQRDATAGGVHYPRSAGEFRSWFGSDADCLDCLEWLRRPQGSVCPLCGHLRERAVADDGYKCASCVGRTSVTTGTIFRSPQAPLTVWSEACWLIASGTDGMSALSLQRSLEIGSYPTSWAMLHRLRSVLVRQGRDRLTGTVKADETYIGGYESGLSGGRAKGKKVLVGPATKVSTSSATPTSRAANEPARARGEDPGELLPANHRVASLVKRWLTPPSPPEGRGHPLIMDKPREAPPWRAS